MPLIQKTNYLIYFVKPINVSNFVHLSFGQFLLLAPEGCGRGKTKMSLSFILKRVLNGIDLLNVSPDEEMDI